MSTPTATPMDEGRMSITDHLRELRSRLLKCVLAIVLISILGFVLSERILELLNSYYRDAVRDQNAKFVIFDPIEGFAIKLKIAGYFGLFGSCPIWLWQLWRFITPGLKEKERKYAIPFILSSAFLFIFGAFIGLLTLPAALRFLVDVAGKQQQELYSTGKFFYFVTLVILAFGFSFLFPVVLVFLELVNAVTPKQLLSWWRYAIVVIFVLAAVITPSQDPITLIAMAGPMIVLYFGAILVGRLAKK